MSSDSWWKNSRPDHSRSRCPPQCIYTKDGSVAQRTELRSSEPGVAGSSPAGPAMLLEPGERIEDEVLKTS